MYLVFGYIEILGTVRALTLIIYGNSILVPTYFSRLVCLLAAALASSSLIRKQTARVSKARVRYTIMGKLKDRQPFLPERLTRRQP